MVREKELIQRERIEGSGVYCFLSDPGIPDLINRFRFYSCFTVPNTPNNDHIMVLIHRCSCFTKGNFADND